MDKNSKRDISLINKYKKDKSLVFGLVALGINTTKDIKEMKPRIEEDIKKGE